jgi:hypothetical protein
MRLRYMLFKNGPSLQAIPFMVSLSIDRNELLRTTLLLRIACVDPSLRVRKDTEP